MIPQLKRPSFFNGRLLTANDLQAEQYYHRAMHQRHNLICHGTGVVQGLKVSVSKEASGWMVKVEPGSALDVAGNELQLCTRFKLRMPELRTPIVVCFRFIERPSEPVPVGAGDGGEITVASSVTEDSEVVLAAETVASCFTRGRVRSCTMDALPLARLGWSRGGWHVDRTFKAPRAH